MITIKQICQKINLPSIIVEQVMEFDANFHYEDVAESMNKLFCKQSWTDGRTELKEALGDDPKGIKILSCMLKGAIKTYERYISLGIDEKIYFDTLQCFTRFINEHYASFGTYAFDRDFWTSRQLALVLFRIGELEYELYNIDDENVISIHIPSDAKVTPENLRKSYIMAREFFKRYFPDYANVRMVCHSWLLSPNLNKILNHESNILKFQKPFVITRVDIEENDYMEWVFKNPNLPINELPEDTSLQRNLKQYLLKGGKLGTAFGYLMDEPFQEID